MSLALTELSSLRAAGIIGIWNTDVAAGRSVLSAGAAELMAGDPELAEQPLPLEVALGRTHPEDRDWVFGQIRRIRETGGPFAAEFRVLTADGKVRWILTRGSLVSDENGLMRGQGAYIDTTDSHPSPYMPAASFAPSKVDPLENAAEHFLQAHTAIDRVGNSQLRFLTDMLLLEVGRVLARRQRQRLNSIA